jgi:hypothetical protein
LADKIGHSEGGEVKLNLRSRTALSGVLTAVLAAVITVGLGAPQADAASWGFYPQSSGGGVLVEVHNSSGIYAGYGAFAADPGQWNSSTGDTIIAYDHLQDGYGIEVTLSTGRVASTRGLGAPVVVRASGNLPEGNHYHMTVCVIKGTFRDCGGFTWIVTA